MIKIDMQKKVIESMKTGDKIRVKVLRFILSEIKYSEIEKKSELDENEIIVLLRREVKKRKDAIELFRKGKRDDLVIDEEKQVNIIEEYLPKNLSDDQIRKVVKDTISQIADQSNMGKIIGIVMNKVKGKADGSKVAELVKEMLA
jgi:uncharacterized protein